MKTWVTIAALTLCITSVAGSSAHAVDRSDATRFAELQSAAVQAFKQKSYRRAIANARDALNDNPSEAAANRMHRLIGLSRIRQERASQSSQGHLTNPLLWTQPDTEDRNVFVEVNEQTQSGVATLRKLIRRAPVFADDVEVVEAMIEGALDDDGDTLADVTELILLHEKAIALRAASTEIEKQAQLLLQLAAIYHSYGLEHNGIGYDGRPDRGELTAGWIGTVVYVPMALRTLDRVIALNPSPALRATALRWKAEIMFSLDQLFQVPPARHDSPNERKRPPSQRLALAIKYQREAIRRFPNEESAAEALARIAEFHEERDDNKAALKIHDELLLRYPQSEAAKNAKRSADYLRDPSVRLSAMHGVVTPGTKPTFSWSAHNSKTIELAAYSIDMFELLQSVDSFIEIDRFSVAGRMPIVRWSINTGDKGDHHGTQGDRPVEVPVTASGAYLITATAQSPSGETATHRQLILISRLALIAKGASDKVVCFAADSIAGQPRTGTKLLIQRTLNLQAVGDADYDSSKSRHQYDRSSVDANGVAEFPRPTSTAKHKSHSFSAIVAKSGDDYAILLNAPGAPERDDDLNAANLDFAVYSYTDRPVYRPGQSVQFKQIVRKQVNGTYQNIANREMTCELCKIEGTYRGYPSTESVLSSINVTTNEFGTATGRFQLSDSIAPGEYLIRHPFRDQDGYRGGARFAIKEYRRPEFHLSIEPDKPAYQQGDRVRLTVRGNYYFGDPVNHAKVRYSIRRQRAAGALGQSNSGNPLIKFVNRIFNPQSRQRPARSEVIASGRLNTNRSGIATFDFKTSTDAEERASEYRVGVEMIDAGRRMVQKERAITATRHSFDLSIYHSPRAANYWQNYNYQWQPGDRIRLYVKGQNTNGETVDFDGTAHISYITGDEVKGLKGKVIPAGTRITLMSQKISSGKQGWAEVSFLAKHEGRYLINVSAPDHDYGGQVETSAQASVHRFNSSYTRYADDDLEIRLNRKAYAVGDTMRVTLKSRQPESHLLLTVEGEDLHFHRAVSIRGAEETVEIPVTEKFRSGVRLQTTRVENHRLYWKALNVDVPMTDRLLQVKLKVPKETFRPGEESNVAVLVADRQGRPVAAELSLVAVDARMFALRSSRRTAIEEFYYRGPQPMLVQGASSRFSFASLQRYYSNRGGDERSNLLFAPRDPSSLLPQRRQSAAQPNQSSTTRSANARKDFRETAIWVGHLRTGLDGKANANIRFPDSLTNWRLTAIAVTKGTAVGQVSHEVRTHKEMIVRLQGPRYFVKGDHVQLNAVVHNNLNVSKQVRVRISTSNALQCSIEAGKALKRSVGSPTDPQWNLVVPAKGQRQVEFYATAIKSGEAKIIAKAMCDAESDVVERSYPVHDSAVPIAQVKSGTLSSTDNSVSTDFNIPHNIRPGSQKATIRFAPTMAHVVLEPLPYLLEFPYGCNEQTMDRFLPAAVAASTLKQLGIEMSEIAAMSPSISRPNKGSKNVGKRSIVDRKHLDTVIASGLQRLANAQNGDGGWGWWKGTPSNPYITSYIVSGLALARNADVEVSSSRLKDGVQFLVHQLTISDAETRHISRQPLNRLSRHETDEETSLKAYMLYAIGAASSKTLKQESLVRRLRELFARRDLLNDYSRALLALALAAAELRQEANVVADNITDRARTDHSTKTSWWGEADDVYWHQSNVEATSFSLRALLAIDPTNPLIPHAVSWLIRERQGSRWRNTKDTAIACFALTDYMASSGDLDPDLVADIEIGGKKVETIHVTRENLFQIDTEISLQGTTIGTGKKSITIRVRGRGHLYWNAVVSFVTREEKIPPAGGDIELKRDYQSINSNIAARDDELGKLHPGDQVAVARLKQSQRVMGASIRSGDAIEVTLQINARRNLQYVMIEDPRPAGCQPTSQPIRSTLGGLPVHAEVRDDKTSFFIDSLPKGRHIIRYTIRAELPGRYHLLPARAEAMYSTEIRANTAGSEVDILESIKH